MVRTSDKFPGVEWIDGTGEFIKINLKLCIGCANCAKVCLANCFEIIEKKARIRSLKECMECGSCWYICPENAIEFEWPKGGTGYRSEWG
jgi:NAD-dependent dihydropyrimidine dehydrogenase PreA subunit